MLLHFSHKLLACHLILHAALPKSQSEMPSPKKLLQPPYNYLLLQLITQECKGQ